MTARNARFLTRREAVGASLGLALSLGLAACSGQQGTPQSSGGSADQSGSDGEDKATTIKVASLKGPTSIGIASLMDKANKGETQNHYDFKVASSPDEVIPEVAKGGFDIALVPSNSAAVLYNKTDAGVSVIDINTLGVLFVVTANADIREFADLSGHTVYLSGKGASPEYTMRKLLDKAGIASSVTLEYKSEHAEVVSMLMGDESAIGILPQPFVTVATTKNAKLKASIDLTELWGRLNDDGSKLVQGVTIVQRSFLNEHPDAVQSFIREHADSVQAANTDPKAVAPLVVSAGILDSEEVVERAIPGCHLVCITGDEMKAALHGYLQVLFDADAASVGGALPADDFYHVG